jgi:hypothetical protein
MIWVAFFVASDLSRWTYSKLFVQVGFRLIVALIGLSRDTRATSPLGVLHVSYRSCFRGWFGFGRDRRRLGLGAEL